MEGKIMSKKKESTPDRTAVKVILDDHIIAQLQVQAEAMGLSLNSYIRVVLGQHVLQTASKGA